MLYKHKIKFIPVLTMVALIAATLTINLTKAATLLPIDFLSTSQNVGVAAAHTIKFYAITPSAIDTAKAYTLTFESGASGFTNVSSVVAADITLAINGVNQPIVALASIDNTKWGFSVSGNVITLTGPDITPDSTIGGIAAGNLVQINIASVIVNPSIVDNGLGTVAIAGTGSLATDSGTASTPIIAPASVTITATVDPVLVFTLSDTTCALGTLTANNVSTCTYTVTHNTNAETGMVISAIAATGLTDGTNVIDNVVTAPVNASTTVEEYGFNIAGAVGDTVAGSYATDSAFPVSNTPLISNLVPHLQLVDTVTHSVNISSVTPAGSYSQVVTWTAVATF